jgi:phosphoribosylformimino-5-aminoimidazole carboxamide ribotide isomerase
VVDLDGAREGHPVNLETLIAIVQSCRARIQFGGGVRSERTVAALLGLGVERVVVGTALVDDPDLATHLFQTYGPRVVAGIDSRGGVVATSGWLTDSSITPGDLAAQMGEAGCRRIIVTDIERDGMETGPNLKQLGELNKVAGLAVIASGGVGTIQHLMELNAIDIEGVIVGRALYERRFTFDEARQAVARPTG